MNDWHISQVKNRLEKIAKQYGITLLFAGLFGSRAKGYACPESDYDFYVVYHGPLKQYVKVINYDTRQFNEEDVLPPQISFDAECLTNLSLGEAAMNICPGAPPEMAVVTGIIKKTRIQLNFLSFDFFVQEVGRSNLDFRIALGNIKLAWCDETLINSIRLFSKTSFDPEKYKHTGYGRAAKAVTLLKNRDDVRHSEVSDGLYRLFMAWAATTGRMIPRLKQNDTLTLTELIDSYMEDAPDDDEVRQLYCVLELIVSGNWSIVFLQHSGTIISVIDRLIPAVKARNVIYNPEDTSELGRKIKFEIITKINNDFIALLLKGGK
jgi:predicted nucleotidyltransferase